MRTAEWALVMILCATRLGADECLFPKNAVRAAVVCGQVQDPAGELVADVELHLINNDQVVTPGAPQGPNNCERPTTNDPRLTFFMPKLTDIMKSTPYIVIPTGVSDPRSGSLTQWRDLLL